MAAESGEQRDPLVPIASKWPTMLVWSSEEDGGARSDESEVESAGEGPSTAVKTGNPGRGTGPLGGDRPREEEGSSVSEEEGVLEAGFGEGQLIGRVGAPGTPDLFGHGPLDFEDDDPGEQRAALSPWEEEKASPRAASRMASSGRRGRRRRAADASARLCGGVGDAPPDAAAWEEQRLGPVRQWRYGGEAAGCAQCKGSGVKGWKKRLDEEDRRSVVTLEEGELRTSGSESEWWDRQGRGVANPVRQSLQVSQVNSQSKAARERLGEQRKVQERPPLLSPGVVLGPDAEYMDIWVIGHSFIKWAQRQARRASMGDNLGLESARFRVRWIGKGGMLWDELLPRLQTVKGRAHCPDVLLIHLGENDLVRTTGLNLLKKMKRGLQVVSEQWKGSHIVWTAFVPRRV
ncbi:uncharacterized protein [Pleurodeles waltl]|uniref:uncharacterized protein n=1 Tax=Pleurodeles waltl TaxID=8319 RepID=UPI003709AB26